MCTILGWLELKVVRELPARERTRVSVDLRKGQRIWLRRWCRFGGHAWTLTYIVMRKEWLLHDARWSAMHLGVDSLSSLCNAALYKCVGSPNEYELIDALKTWRIQ